MFTKPQVKPNQANIQEIIEKKQRTNLLNTIIGIQEIVKGIQNSTLNIKNKRHQTILEDTEKKIIKTKLHEYQNREEIKEQLLLAIEEEKEQYHNIDLTNARDKTIALLNPTLDFIGFNDRITTEEYEKEIEKKHQQTLN